MFDIEPLFFSAPGSVELGISVVFGVAGSVAAENRSDNSVHIVTFMSIM
jgi:hypothetical protein